MAPVKSYVTEDGVDLGTGCSWENRSRDIQTAAVRRMGGILARVSTLFTHGGFTKEAIGGWIGRRGRAAMPRLPSRDSIRAVSSPQI